jgi:hypothetical protein
MQRKEDELDGVLKPGDSVRISMHVMDSKRSVAATFDAASHRPGFRVIEGTARDAAYAESVRVLSDSWRDPATKAADAERDAVIGQDMAMADAQARRDAAWHRSVEAMEQGWKS